MDPKKLEEVIHVKLQSRPSNGTTAGPSGSIKITFSRKSTKNFRSIDLKKSRSEVVRLSITADIEDGPCGQCISDVRKIWSDDPRVSELCDLWERWHLNDLRAGTRAQMDAVSKMGKCPSSTEWFSWVCKNLESQGLLVDRGYSFGQEWLFERIPATVVKRIKTLAKEISR
jgi:hypothetical protein